MEARLTPRPRAFVRSATTVLAGLMLSTAAVARGQTVVAGNIGPGDTYQHGTANSWRVGVSNDAQTQFENAVSFVFSGASPASLYNFTWVINYFSGNATIFADFLEGTDIATATTLTGGNWPGVPPFATNSGEEHFLTTGPITGVTLNPGETYWIRLRLNVPANAGDIWGWQWNDQGQTGYKSRSWDISVPAHPVDNGWIDETGATPAFRVETLNAVATPEPASLVLTASGLLFVGGLVRRRARRTPV